MCNACLLLNLTCLFRYLSATLIESVLVPTDPCQPMRFKLPAYSEGTEYFKSEVTIYHQVSKESLRKMRNRLKSRPYNVDVCIKLGSSCTPIFNNITISPEYDGWVTFKFQPYFLIAAGQQYVELYIMVSHRGRPVRCSNWPLKFITDDSIGQDMIPVHTVYTHKPRESVLRTFLNEALKSPPIANSETDQSRQKRSAIQGCRKKDLFIRAGWDLKLSGGMTFSKTFNIGYCGGVCNLLTEEKESERLAVLNLAKRHGFMNQTDYPEHCVPGTLEQMQIVLFDPSSRKYEFLDIPNFMVRECVCLA